MPPRTRRLALAAGAAGLLGAWANGPDDDPPAAVDYRRDVRPILSDNCYACHGPDAAQRQAGLRLDVRDSALARTKSGAVPVVPGAPAESELWYRVNAAPDERMPPPDSRKELSAGEIEVLRAWIEEGAAWGEHWAFVAPRRPALPDVAAAAWPRNPIDRFVLARLEELGLEPAPEAARETWARRVAFDLNGLPPALGELDEYLADDCEGADARFVERLLASPRYGEHMARYWLDAARYGDTHGLHLDNERALWRWRDWVIEAFNAGLPFDRFVTEQLAGDLFPDATLEQRIATGFNRCNPTTGEGGLIAEEYLAKYAMDRVDTTGTVFMGLTLGCAQCHDHKFDPFTQREYYELFAFFNNLAEEGSDENALAPPPFVKAPTPEEARELEAALAAALEAEARLDAPLPGVDALQADWEAEWGARLRRGFHRLEPLAATSRDGATLTVQPDGSVLAGGANPARDEHVFVLRTSAEHVEALYLEGLTDPSLPNAGVGRAPNANVVLTNVALEVAPADGSAAARPVRLAAAVADYSQPGYPIGAAIDGDPASGWAVDGGQREPRSVAFVPEAPFGFAGGTELRVRLSYESQFGQHALGRVRFAAASDPALVPAAPGTWHVAGPYAAQDGDVAYRTPFAPELRALDPDDATVGWKPRNDLVDGERFDFTGEGSAVYLHRTIRAPEPRRVTLSLGSDDALKVWHDGTIVLERNVQRSAAPDQDRVELALHAGANHLLFKVVNHAGGFAFHYRMLEEDAESPPPDLAQALAAAQGALRADLEQRLRRFFRRRHSPEWRALEGEARRAREAAAAIEARMPLTMVSAERAERRPAHVLIRGRYDRPGEAVEPGVPAALPPLAAEGRADRLDLARWLARPDHPLTARVFVNRLWQNVFGTGIVATAEDFGAQGEWPSHPELLDWLAVELVESGWDVRRVLRLIVTSATYRQSSRVTPETLARDPQNRLLARGPRFRLDAETVRDTALALGGLLVEKIGGPSVKPYQPAGLWQAVAYPTSNTAKFVQDEGQALYRRSLYTFWKRTSPPPGMQAFDAPSREACRVRRARTNTPLQALVLLNDVQFVEAARGFAQRILDAEGSVDERLVLAFRSATARRPSAGELAVLRHVHRRALEGFLSDEPSARALVEFGDSEPPPGACAELAAWTVVASTILNLDETITKG